MTPLLRISCFVLTLVTPASAQDVDLGNRLFQIHCSYCHGANGRGGRGADLTLGQYRHGGSDRELFQTIRNGIEGSEMGPVRASEEDVWRLVVFVKKLGKVGATENAAGDAAAGKLVYENKGCPSCHIVNNLGRNVGPELTAIGRIRGVTSLEESLLDPAADLPVTYRGVRVITKSGETVEGVRLNEDDFSIKCAIYKTISARS